MSAMAVIEPRVHPWRQPHLAASFHMMKWAVVSSVAASVVCAAIGYAASGVHAMASALFGALAVVVFFASGMPVQLMAMGQQLQAGIGIVIICYVSRVATLGLVLVSMTDNGLVARPDLMPMVWSIVVTTLAWVGGLLAGHSHARVPVYDPPQNASKNAGR